MPRLAPVVLAILIAAALLLWFWKQSPTSPPTATDSVDSSQPLDSGSGTIGTAAAANAEITGGPERTAARPIVEAPVFVVEGLVLGDPLQPELGTVRVLAYAGEATDSSGVIMSGLDGRASSPSFVLRGEPIATANADALGNFVLRAPAADLRLTIEHDHYILPMPEIVHVVASGQSAHVVLAPILGGSLRGRLFGERRGDVSRVMLRIEPDPMSMMRDPRMFLGAMLSGRSGTDPDADGVFVFRGVLPGAPLTLSATGGEAFAHLPQPPLAPGETREVALTVSSAANLEVTIVDGNGDPIGEATVSVRPVDAAGSMFPQLQARHEATGADGRCSIASLRPSRIAVEAMASGFVAAEAKLDLHAAPETNSIRLTLGVGGVVTGTVTGPDGKPIADAGVAHHPSAEVPLLGNMVAQLGPTHLAQVAQQGVRTDSEGRFRLTGLADDDEFMVIAAHPAFGASFASGVRMGDTDVAIALLELGGVKGRLVTAEDGAPIESFTIRVLKTMFLVLRAPVHTEAITSADGTFDIIGIPPGDYTAEFAANGRSVVNKDLTITAAGLDMGTIEMPRGAAVSGVVRDENGRPVRGALVRRRQGSMADNPVMAMFSGGTASVRSGKDGTFTLDALSPGRIQLIASADGFASGTSERLRLEAGQQIADLEIALGHGGTIVGRLLTGPGESIADFMLMAQEQRTQISVGGDLDANGTFTIENLDPGLYVVQAMPRRIFDDIGGQNWKPGQGMQLGEMFQKITDSVVSQRCTVRAGETAEVELDAGDLIIGTRWTVRVEVGGKPMQNGLVEAVAIDGGRMRAAMFLDGAAVFGGIEPGAYSVRVRSGMTMAPVGAGQVIEYPEGREEHTTMLSLPGGELRGRVVDAASGDPLQAALVRLIHEDAAEQDDSIGLGLTDADGNFTFPGLEDGLYGVVTAGHLSDRDGAASQRRIQVTAGSLMERVELRSRPAAAASVLVTTENGVPVAGATALCVDATGRPIGALGVATTDPNGRAWFGGMPSGDARIVARAPGLAPGTSGMRTLDAERAAEFSLILTSGTQTTMLAVDASGQPLEGATVSARQDGGPWLPPMLLVERAGHGTYELGRLGRGTWEFRLQHPAVGSMVKQRDIGTEPAITVVIAPE